jgi:hypothetical protein
MVPSRGEHHARPERRKSYRCAVHGARRRGRLRIGLRNVAVLVLDESAEGLALEVEGAADCKIGDTVLVEIASAWFETRVVNLCLTESAAEDSNDATPVTRTRIGLVRLREIEASLVDPDDFPLFSWMRMRSLLVPLAPLGKSAKGAAALIVGGIAVTGALLWAIESWAPMAEAMRQKAEEEGELQGDLERFTPTVQPGKPAAANREQPAKKEKRTTPTKALARSTARPDQASSPSSPAAAAFPLELARLARPDFLLKPEVIKLLALSVEQREQLRQLFEERKTSSTELAASGAARGGDDPIVELGRRALAILTVRQRQLLAQLQSAMKVMPGAAASGAASPPPDDASAPSRG